MAITIPSELAWVLNMLGYDWPEIDEDEVQKGAVLLRQYGEDLDAAIRRADSIISDKIVPGYRTQAGASFGGAWTDNRSNNMQGFVELIPPASTGLDVLADAVIALKLKVIAELVITAAQIAAAIASAAFTFGLSAAANVAIIAARKKALDFLTNVAIEQAMTQILGLVAEPLMGVGEHLIQQMSDAPLVQGAVGELEAFEADLAALEDAADELDENAEDQGRITDEFVAQFSALQFSTAG
ncbi:MULTISPECIES: hypothetical protein [unclassified Agrococcus]|uniref:WXG100-like domain-containing protein n=1 Tax=unclassified Agrococcus TaxID=2615065 RepID=UPI00361959AE